MRYLNTRSRAPLNGGSPVRRLFAHRNGLPHRQDAGLPRGGHAPGDGARDADQLVLGQCRRAAALMAQPHDAGPVYVSEYDYPVKLTFAGQLYL